MNRRHFLANSALVTGAAVFTGVLSGNNMAHAARELPLGFSLELLTDTPDKALKVISGVIPYLSNGTVIFDQHFLTGQFKGDIAFISNNKLIDFRRGNSSVTKQLARAGKELNLPRTISDPVLLTFRSESRSIKPEYINIFTNNKLIDRLSINSAAGERTITSNKGEMHVHFSNGSIKAVDTSCKHKTCRQIGSIHDAGQSILCIPSQIRVAIDGRGSNGIDGVSY